MSWCPFIGASGHDHGASPYQVLAGVALQAPAVRSVTAQLHEAEIRRFGRRYSHECRELKGKVLPAHSDLTTGVQIADLVAYVISRGFRTPQMTKPARAELSHLANQVARPRYRATRERRGNPELVIWSFAHITDLRTQAERDEGPSKNKKGNEAPKRLKASTENRCRYPGRRQAPS